MLKFGVQMYTTKTSPLRKSLVEGDDLPQMLPFEALHIGSHKRPVGSAVWGGGEEKAFVGNTLVVYLSVETILFRKLVDTGEHEKISVPIQPLTLKASNMIASDKGIGMKECTPHTPTIGKCDTVAKDTHSRMVTDEPVNTIVFGSRRDVGYITRNMVVFLQALPALYFGKDLGKKKRLPLSILQSQAVGGEGGQLGEARLEFRQNLREDRPLLLTYIGCHKCPVGRAVGGGGEHYTFQFQSMGAHLFRVGILFIKPREQCDKKERTRFGIFVECQHGNIVIALKGIVLKECIGKHVQGYACLKLLLRWVIDERGDAIKTLTRSNERGWSLLPFVLCKSTTSIYALE